MLAAAVVLGACASARPSWSDGSRWEIDPKTGEQVKVGTWQHDADGNPVNRQGNTEGATNPKAPSGKEAAQDGLRHAASTTGWIAGLLMLASVAGVVASFFVPWLPRSTAIKAVVVALALFIVQYWLNRYGEGLAVWSFWLVLALLVASVLAFGWPWIVALYNRNREQVALRLAKSGDPRAAAALYIEARPDDFKTPEAKKAVPETAKK
jgi:hypothetical protein